MKEIKAPSFPPNGNWDARMVKPKVCRNLQPVETLHQNDWFAIRNRGGYYTLEYNLPQVVILPIVDNMSVVMIRAKRPVLEDVTLEIPAGSLDLGEEPSAGAAREMAEETGIIVEDMSRFIPMPPLATSPNRNPKLAYIFRIHLTKDEYRKRQPHDEEVESVECLDFDEIKRKIASGEIYVAIPISVISSYLFTDTLNNL